MLPIREAVKRQYDLGVRAMLEGGSGDWHEHVQQLLIDAATGQGYAYPPSCGDPYKLAKDYESWLDGALRMTADVREGTGRLEEVEPVWLNRRNIVTGLWSADNGYTHLFRISDRSPDPTLLRWPELLLSALCPEHCPIVIHTLILPAPTRRSATNSDYRLPSPLSIAYQNRKLPHTRYRLAHRKSNKEGGRFDSKWAVKGRWELAAEGVEWEEWRKGMDLDECVDRVIQHHTVPPYDGDVDAVRVQALSMIAALGRDIDTWPLYHEKCRGCMYNLYCHGTAEEKGEYVSIAGDSAYVLA